MFGVPAHLVPVVAVLAVFIFFALMRAFRKSPTAKKFVEESLGDDTPEAALSDYRLARERLLRHRARLDSNTDLARRIDVEMNINNA